jgi:hypothetical protein
VRTIVWALLMSVLGPIAGHGSERCKLGDGIWVLPSGEVEAGGELTKLMKKSGNVTLDLTQMTATYELKITTGEDVRSFDGTSPLKRTTTRPDDHWMCDQPKCGDKKLLDALLSHLRVDPSRVDTVEFLGFVVDSGKSAGEPSAESHDIVRFLGGGKMLASGMFFQAMYTILFWPCR